jgi:adenine-specific DNA-methyltransferase
MIYIDPPYNRGGKDFIYDDIIVDQTDSFTHSKWLSFLRARLTCAKSLLKPDGLIFISIDDNEQAYLKILCDDIFEEKNFYTQIIIQSNKRGQTDCKNPRIFTGLYQIGGNKI